MVESHKKNMGFLSFLLTVFLHCIFAAHALTNKSSGLNHKHYFRRLQRKVKGRASYNFFTKSQDIDSKLTLRSKAIQILLHVCIEIAKQYNLSLSMHTTLRLQSNAVSISSLHWDCKAMLGWFHVYAEIAKQCNFVYIEIAK